MPSTNTGDLIVKKSIVDFADDELGRLVKERHGKLSAAHAAGHAAEHPSETWNRHSAELRAHRAAGGNVASSKEIMLEGSPQQEEALGEDDPPATPGTPKVQRPGTPTMDSIIPGYSRLGGGGKTFVHDREDDGVTLKTTGRMR
jgi:hypothetical protein